MITVPDAPWVRDAELNGMPSADPPRCPVCGAEPEDYVYRVGKEVIGCDQCIERTGVWEWEEEG